MNKQTSRLLAVTCLMVFLGVSGSPLHGAAPGFQGIGALPGGYLPSSAAGVSGDGQYVVGWSGSSIATAPLVNEGLRLSLSSGLLQGLGDLPGGWDSSLAYAASFDGSAVVGASVYSNQVWQAFRWTPSGGMTALGFLPDYSSSRAYSVSADGTAVAGYSATSYNEYPKAFRWTAATGMEDLGWLSGDNYSTAYDISGDGSIVVGVSLHGSTSSAFRWTSATGMQALAHLSGGTQGTAKAVTADGRYAVGWSNGASQGSQACLWTPDGSVQPLGFLPLPDLESDARAISDDGRIVVGLSGYSNNQRAFIWDAQHGMRDLASVLTNDFGLNLAGWTLKVADGISADGTVIVGTGINPAGQNEGWVAQIPEPATLSLLAAGGVAILRRRRKNK